MTDPADASREGADKVRDNAIDQTADAVLRMLRERAEDGQIHITDIAVETFIVDALRRILRGNQYWAMRVVE